MKNYLLPAPGLLLSLLTCHPATRNGGALSTHERDGVLPTYECVLALEPKAETSANIAFGDVDNDGNLDIVLAKGRHWPLVDRVLLGDGRGGVRASYDLGNASDRSYSGRVVDMDGDGSLDVVISNDAPDPKLVYLNDGRGHFRVGSSYGRPEWPTRNASVADMNGDGLPDIVVANRGSGPDTASYVCLNRGGGRFDDDCMPIARYSTTTIAPADMNGDGRMDLVIPNRDGGQSYVYLAGPGGVFSDDRRTPFGPADATFRVAEVADLDADGLQDIVAIDEQQGVSAYFQHRAGDFSPPFWIAKGKPTPYALVVADLNGDARVDVVVGHVEAPSAVYFNDGTGRSYRAVRFGDDKGTAYVFAIGDVNKDGVMDIGVARSEAANVVFFGARR